MPQFLQQTVQNFSRDKNSQRFFQDISQLQVWEVVPLILINNSTGKVRHKLSTSLMKMSTLSKRAAFNMKTESDKYASQL